MRDCKLKTWLMGALCWGVCQVVNAQLAVATVNGVTVPATLLEQVVRNNAKQDITETPEFRRFRDVLLGIVSDYLLQQGGRHSDAIDSGYRKLGVHNLTHSPTKRSHQPCFEFAVPHISSIFK